MLPPANKFKLIIFFLNMLKVKNSLKFKFLLDNLSFLLDQRDKLFVFKRQHNIIINYN